jgi:hypothetical protein
MAKRFSGHERACCHLFDRHRRIHGAQRWLESGAAAEEVLIVGATLDAATELARKVAKKKGAPRSAGIGTRCPS